MIPKILLVAGLLFGVIGCSPDVVYVDRETGQPVQPVKRMPQITPREIVCLRNKQYAVIYYYNAVHFVLMYDDYNNRYVYCDDKTLPNGTQGK